MKKYLNPIIGIYSGEFKKPVSIFSISKGNDNEKKKIFEIDYDLSDFKNLFE
jgi:hypothetical protein